MNQIHAPEDDALVRLLRAAMEERTEAVPPAPGWGQIRPRLERARRRHRLRAAASLGVAVLAVVAVAAGVAAVHRPAAGRDVGPAVSPLNGRVTRGSLATDQAWLTAVRQRSVTNQMKPRRLPGAPLTDAKPSPYVISFVGRPDPGTWVATSARDVRVIFAGDVDGYRVALVSGGWKLLDLGGRTSAGSSPAAGSTLQRWFVGPAGASVRAMQSGPVRVASTSPAGLLVQPGSITGSTPAMRRTGLAMTLSQVATDARLAGPATYAANGTVTLRRADRPLTRRKSWLAVADVPADGGYRLVSGGTAPPGEDKLWVSLNPDERFDLTRPATNGPVVLPDRLNPGRGGLVPPRRVLQYSAEVVQRSSGLPVAGSTVSLLAALPEPDRHGRPSEWVVVMTVSTPSGATFVGATAVLPSGQTVPSDPGAELRGWTVHPAGSPGTIAMAWASGNHVVGSVASDLTSFIGPVGAVRAEVLNEHGQVKSQATLNHTIGVAGGGKSVRFLDAGSRFSPTRDWVRPR
jgi:hypothetical protein